MFPRSAVAALDARNQCRSSSNRKKVLADDALALTHPNQERYMVYDEPLPGGNQRRHFLELFGSTVGTSQLTLLGSLTQVSSEKILVHDDMHCSCLGSQVQKEGSLGVAVWGMVVGCCCRCAPAISCCQVHFFAISLWGT